MPTGGLTDAKCRAEKPTDKMRKVFDAEGLYLGVAPSGRKTWRVAYRLGGKQQTMSIGPYPAVSLAKARARRDEIKALLRDGADPMAPRKAERGGRTFEDAARHYWNEHRKNITPGYRDNVIRGLEMHIFPALGSRPIGALTVDEVLDALNLMDAKGLHDYVRKVRIWMGKVFTWAKAQKECAINPCAQIDPKDAFVQREKKNFPSLTPRELPEFMQRLALERDLSSVLACRLLALTWVRTNELRFMTWAELDGDVWHIGGKRMKMKDPHIVPLSRQAMAILDVLRARAGRSPYVLPAEHRPDRPLSENAILALIARIGYKGRMTGHGWRSCASTWANERGFNRDAIERQLAHREKGVRGVYNHAEFMPARREMLQVWADWLDDIEAA